MRFLTAKLTPTRYILIVLQLLRKDARFFLAGTLVAVALRLVFVLHFPGIVDDSRLYADIAMNWLQYGVSGSSFRRFRMEQLPRRTADPDLIRPGLLFSGSGSGAAGIQRARGESRVHARCSMPVPRQLFCRGPYRNSGDLLHRAGAGSRLHGTRVLLAANQLKINRAVDRLRSLHRSLHPVAARRWNSAGCDRRIL